MKRKPKPKAIAAQPTKEQRRKERAKIGKLRNQVVTSKTEERYKESFRAFCSYHRLSWSSQLPGGPATDDLVSEFIEMLWESGEAKSQANYTLAAIQYFRPETKHHLPWSWKLVKVWNTLEMPQRANPLTPELLLSFAGQAFLWKQFEFGWLLIVGFTLFLRTGELLSLKAQDINLGRSSGVVFMAPSKGAKRSLLPLERVEITEQSTLKALRILLRNKQPGDYLWSQSRHQFMSLWHSVVQSLKLDQCHFYPYSLRRGGASSAYRAGSSLDQLVTKGRWSNVSTARLYLDLGMQALTALSLPPVSRPPLSRARQVFFTVSQSGTRGMGGANVW